MVEAAAFYAGVTLGIILGVSITVIGIMIATLISMGGIIDKIVSQLKHKLTVMALFISWTAAALFLSHSKTDLVLGCIVFGVYIIPKIRSYRKQRSALLDEIEDFLKPKHE